MPARRLPWFKLWPEAMRHEKVVLLSDGAFRTWIVTLAAGSEQAIRWRFASVAHVVSVTGRPEAEINELIGAKLLDASASGEVWVHDWRQWQDRYASDFAPRTLRNGSANVPRSLPGELRGENKSTEREGETSPLPPPHAEGELALTTATTDDVSLWERAVAAASDGMLPANAERIGALEPIGRGPDGGLRLRAPPDVGPMARFVATIRAGLEQVGDEHGRHAQIVTRG